MFFKKKEATKKTATKEAAPTPTAEKAAPKQETKEEKIVLRPGPAKPPTLNELADELELAYLSATPEVVMEAVAKDLRKLAEKKKS